MRSEALRNLIKAAPFRPFRIHLTNGQRYEVRYPDLAMVGNSEVIVGFPKSENDLEPMFDRFVILGLLHIVNLEPLAAGTPPPPVASTN